MSKRRAQTLKKLGCYRAQGLCCPNGRRRDAPGCSPTRQFLTITFALLGRGRLRCLGRQMPDLRDLVACANDHSDGNDDDSQADWNGDD